MSSLLRIMRSLSGFLSFPRIVPVRSIAGAPTNGVPHRRGGGFTLIEMLMVIALISILVSIAVQQYQRYVIHARLQAVLVKLSLAQVEAEQFFLEHRSYGSIVGSTLCNTLSAVGGALAPTSIDTADYTCAVSAGGATYTITATNNARFAGAGAGDYSYSIDSSGQQKTLRVERQDLSAAPANCWLYSRDTGCRQ